MTEAHPQVDDDPYRWLEEVTGTAALDWVRARNAETVEELTHGERFARLRDELREVLDADDRIPYVRRRGEYLYNFWRDAAHPRGLWRRTTLDEYRRAEPDWDVLLDIDALAEAEGENWVWQGAAVLRPGFRRCLVELSRGGADATVVREFDLDRREFVPDGFTLPEAKSSVAWIDEDRIYVGTDFGEGSLTSSGYPRLVKEWRRGTPLSEATLVFEGKPEDVAVRGFHDPTEGWERDLVRRSIDFYRSELYLRTADGLVRVDVPDDAVASVHREWLLVRTRSPWRVAGAEHPGGTLLAARLEDFLAGERTMTVLFEPDAHTSLDYYDWTRHHLVVGTLSDVTTRLRVLTPGPDGWRDEPLPGVPEIGSVQVVDTEPDHSDEILLDVTGYTQPSSLVHGEVGGELETLKQAPAFFDSAGITTEQFFATSADGTRIPYFVVGAHRNGPGPTLLTGYGGFEVSLTPSYSGMIGRGWLARGGTYVVANLRGGGEYGPDWHSQAVKAHRHRVYEDFAAVAADLVARGVTTPATLGIQGGSNGGLLMGVMLTRHPERFGAIVSQVPLLDMRRYHQLLAGASWMAEYGDPDDPAEWAYLGPYSPYHNVRSGQNYPPTLFVTSTRDDRVHPGHARKMVALMREHGYDVRYHENIEGGHGAAADNAQLAFKWALVFEFLWEQLAPAQR
ncbi:prolyl oligopeptidase family serine peptidase [Prauserella muralis]|uniref:Prolyl oligopeptidase n=1 Tax=Prauserella muralis TaxID=588067 RepID=A0A2V4AI07_9PSEU|nr:prolyl oligopeptidase family serine peptidase [Prauserella muralis]PXY19564.1 prolyl oligopeptidase [Prauserella muralis]TWE29555.1 prolyl oligopeptidase [Prauserella muralis]